MARVRIPRGVCTPGQWLQLDRVADERANGTLRLTTRQAIQLHGIIKGNLKSAIQAINESLLDTIAACGDVNRNVIANSNPHQSKLHTELYELSKRLGQHLLPRSRAYHEMFLDGNRVASSSPVEEEEPIYGQTYLPRKFKIALAIPPDNDVDIFANDLGFIAVVEDGKIVGYNVAVGGGQGMTHGKTETYPRNADILAFCTPEDVLEVAEHVVGIQRDFGDRVDRAHARMKYTIEDRGTKWFRHELETRIGYKLEDPKKFEFTTRGDRFGWTEGIDQKGHYTLFIQNGRVKDDGDRRLKSALREIARIHDGDFRLTPNQNLVIGRVSKQNRGKVEELLREYGIETSKPLTGLRLNSIACVVLPTCGLALAESERYLPELIDELEKLLESLGLRDDEIIIRMTGCPNGCARPYLAEIGLVGKNPRTYNIYLGASFVGDRMNKLYRADVKDAELVSVLRPILEDYAKNCQPSERFGDFTIRRGYVKASANGPRFHR